MWEIKEISIPLSVGFKGEEGYLDVHLERWVGHNTSLIQKAGEFRRWGKHNEFVSSLLST